jgi:hypothetical protein
MPWGIAAAAVVGAYSANQQSKAAKGAANAQTRAADAATEEQRRQFDLTRQDQQPWMQAGQNALTQMQALNSGDFSSFKESPDYQFAFNQGLQGLDRSAAARGSLLSGGHSADVLQLAGGIASQNYGNFYNRLAGLSGTGQTTATNLGSLGANMAGNIGNNYLNAGNARASAYGQIADTNSQFAAGLGGQFNNWYQKQSANNGGGTGWYLGNNPGKG